MLGNDPELVQLADGLAFAEGVCWVSDKNKVIVSDIPNNRIVSWSESDGFGIYREPSGCSNGNTVDREGRVLSCLTRGRTVVREEHETYLYDDKGQHAASECHVRPETYVSAKISR